MLQIRSSGSVRTISLDRSEVLRALGVIAATIRGAHPEVASIRLFGSMARGDQVGTSDVDVLIVLRDNDPLDPLEGSRAFYRYFNIPVPVDLLVCNEVHAATRVASGDPHFTRIWQESLEL